MRFADGDTPGMTRVEGTASDPMAALADHCVACVDAAWVEANVVPVWQALQSEGLLAPPLLLADLRALVGDTGIGAGFEGKRFGLRRAANEWRTLLRGIRSRLPARSMRGERETCLVACARAVASQLAWIDDGEKTDVAASFESAVLDEIRAASGKADARTAFGTARARMDAELTQRGTAMGLLGPAPAALLARRDAFDFDPCVRGLLADGRGEFRPQPFAGGSGTARDPISVAVPRGPFWKVQRSKLPDDLTRLVPIEMMYLGTPGLETYWLWRAVTGELQTRFGRESRPSHRSPLVFVRLELSDDPRAHRFPAVSSDGMSCPPISWLRATLVEVLRLTAAQAVQEGWRLWTDVAVVRRAGSGRRGRPEVAQFRATPPDVDRFLGSAEHVLSQLAQDLPALFQVSRRPLTVAAPRAPLPRSVDLGARIVFGSAGLLRPSVPGATIARAARVGASPSGFWGMSVSDELGRAPTLAVHHGEARASPTAAARVVLTRMLSADRGVAARDEVEFAP
jgi:hypothetical protein